MAVVLILLLASLHGALSIVHGSPPATPSAATCTAITSRINCGYSNITQSMCETRGCCFDSSVQRLTSAPKSERNWQLLDRLENDEPTCFYPGNGLTIRKVHLVQSNHFDAGWSCLQRNGIALPALQSAHSCSSTSFWLTQRFYRLC